LKVQFLLVLPHWMKDPPVKHWLVVGQLLVTLSQVMELVWTEQEDVPEQVMVWEEAKQERSQGG
jgi:hypothetical protein